MSKKRFYQLLVVMILAGALCGLCVALVLRSLTGMLTAAQREMIRQAQQQKAEHGTPSGSPARGGGK